MTIRLLIDASHKEQTRMAVINGKRLDEYDQVNNEKAPIKGNIYLGKITRVEPSLQAAFIDYGTNRHGFLSFAEIHPDYYKIPTADREAIIAEEEMADDYDEEDDNYDDEEAPQSNRANYEEGERARRRHYSKLRNSYKIQEVIKKNQIVLVQVVKEERGNKGAALTTYISLAGRYCVLMPNTTRGGGVSRKISDIRDRKRLKSIITQLDVPSGMGVILRTAGAERSEQEIIRDFEYVSNLWDEIRTVIMESHAPKLINEESNLVNRAIRDYYRSDVDEILVEGDEAYHQAYSTLKSLIPSHIKRLHRYKSTDKTPIFTEFGVEKQIQMITDNIVQLQGGGFLVINQTEALVAIDVNSGKAIRERHIEETAVKTNLEAAEEVARQVRLRDLAGLIVIDFIDMLEKSNVRRVESRLKDCLKRDRARLQVGYISSFGLLEMSRQRLRQSMADSMGERCPHCMGTGTVLNQESQAMNLVREIHNKSVLFGSGLVKIQTSPQMTTYLLSQKRDKITDLANELNLELSFDLLPLNSNEKFIVTHENEDGRPQTRSLSNDYEEDHPTRSHYDDSEHSTHHARDTRDNRDNRGEQKSRNQRNRRDDYEQTDNDRDDDNGDGGYNKKSRGRNRNNRYERNADSDNYEREDYDSESAPTSYRAGEQSSERRGHDKSVSSDDRDSGYRKKSHTQRHRMPKEQWDNGEATDESPASQPEYHKSRRQSYAKPRYEPRKHENVDIEEALKDIKIPNASGKDSDEQVAQYDSLADNQVADENQKPIVKSGRRGRPPKHNRAQPSSSPESVETDSSVAGSADRLGAGDAALESNNPPQAKKRGRKPKVHQTPVADQDSISENRPSAEPLAAAPVAEVKESAMAVSTNPANEFSSPDDIPLPPKRERRNLPKWDKK